MKAATGVLQTLADAVAAAPWRWWGFALSWHGGRWSATVVSSVAAASASAVASGVESQEWEGVVGPTLTEAVGLIAAAVGVPGAGGDVADGDLAALEALLSSAAVVSLVVAYDAVVDGVPGEQWEIYGSGRIGELHADGVTYAEAISGLG